MASKKWLEGDFINVFECLMGGRKEDGPVFIVVPSDRTGGYKHN